MERKEKPEKEIFRMINEMSVERRNVQTADAFSALFLSYVFFFRIARL